MNLFDVLLARKLAYKEAKKEEDKTIDSIINGSISGIIKTDVSRVNNYAFAYCNIDGLDCTKTVTIGSYAFFSCSRIKVIILRGDLSAITNVNALNYTPFASAGSGGTLYVPQSLIASYQSADNWSTFLGYPNNQIKAIEGSIYE